jgi:hypothetical protein
MLDEPIFATSKSVVLCLLYCIGLPFPKGCQPLASVDPYSYSFTSCNMTVMVGVFLCEIAAFTLALSMNIQQYGLTNPNAGSSCSFCSPNKIWGGGLFLYGLSQASYCLIDTFVCFVSNKSNQAIKHMLVVASVFFHGSIVLRATRNHVSRPLLFCFAFCYFVLRFVLSTYN